MDYTVLAMESLLDSQKVWQELKARKLVEESNFIIECMNTGYIANLEALEMVPVTESIISAIIAFFEKIAGLFREKAIERSKKYDEWLKEYQDELIARCKKANSLKLSPYWNGKWREDGNALASDIMTGFQNHENGKYNNYQFTSRYLANFKILTEGERSDLNDSLKQYFRFGLKQTETPEEIEMTGEALSSHIEDMIKFNLNYVTECPKIIDNIKTAIARGLDKITPPDGNNGGDSSKPTDVANSNNAQGTTDSIDASTWLDVEQRPIYESSLRILANYSTIFEENKPGNTPGDANRSPTSVRSAEEEDKSKQEASDYFSNVETFAKSAVTAYQTALEERYIVYTKIFLAISDSDIAPKFDKNGNYITKDKREKAKEDSDNKPEKNSTRQRISDTGRKVKGFLSRKDRHKRNNNESNNK